MTSSPAQDLCTACGMCCDGTMFGAVPVEEHERSRLSAIFELETTDGTTTFRQPCPQNQCHRCQVYDLRPSSCRGYRCLTLKALDAGEIDVDEGARRIAEVLKAREAVRAMMLPGETLTAARLRRKELAADASRLPAATGFILALTALDLLLDRYVREQDLQMFKAGVS